LLYVLDDNADITQALQRLTDPGHGIPVSSLSTAVTKATTSIPILGEGTPQEYPISKELMDSILKVCSLSFVMNVISIVMTMMMIARFHTMRPGANLLMADCRLYYLKLLKILNIMP